MSASASGPSIAATLLKSRGTKTSPTGASSHSKNPANKQVKEQVKRRAGALELPALTLLMTGILLYGWLQSSERHLTAEEGLGYYLGIIGSLMMVALLAYPLRKRFRALKSIGDVRSWFKIHMLLGVAGPALILLHSNFSLGSFNSSVALISMLIVAGSGFIGRFFYSRIHRGLYGRKAIVQEFLNDAGSFKIALREDEPNSATVFEMLKGFEHQRLRHAPNVWVGIWRAISSRIAGRRLHKQIMSHVHSLITQRAINQRWSKKQWQSQLDNYSNRLDKYFDAISRAEAFSLYEKLFSYWHMLHLPLFIILVFAAIVHILAVHLY